jgi:hypothetical protein
VDLLPEETILQTGVMEETTTPVDVGGGKGGTVEEKRMKGRTTQEEIITAEEMEVEIIMEGGETMAEAMEEEATMEMETTTMETTGMM